MSPADGRVVFIDDGAAAALVRAGGSAGVAICFIRRGALLMLMLFPLSGALSGCRRSGTTRSANLSSPGIT